MTETVNRQWRLVDYPEGLPKETTFRLVEAPLPEPRQGQVLVRALILSVDPYVRGRMHPRKSYADPMKPGEVIVGGAAGRVVASRHPGFHEGDLVDGMLGWQDYAAMNGEALRKLDPDPALLPASQGVLGMPGLTAYFGLLDVGRPVAGETVLVSGAAGAVGTVVGQIAKITGCRAVGVAGSVDKVRLLTGEAGFDEAFDYKTVADIRLAMSETCPDGVDVYFDNVGGPITDAAMTLINLRARVIVCGQISQYNATRPPRGPRQFHLILAARATVRGILVSDWSQRYDEGLAQLTSWYRAGLVRSFETVVEGLENAPVAFIGLFHGHNVGKQLVRIADP